jgi:hypothetical protein
MCVVLQPHKLTSFLLVAPIHFFMGAPEWVPQILIWFRDHYLGSLKSSIGIREMPPGPANPSLLCFGFARLVDGLLR